MHANDVVATLDGQVQHRPLVIVALKTKILVVVLFRPAMDSFHELRSDSMAAVFSEDAVEPDIEDVRFQLEAEAKSDGTLVDAGDQHQCIVAAAKAPLKAADVACRPKNLIVKGANDGQVFGTHPVDDRISHSKTSSFCQRSVNGRGDRARQSAHS